MRSIDTIGGSRSVPSHHTAVGRFPVLSWLARAVAWLELRMEKRRSRRALLELNDEQLKDVGLSRADAYREGIRPFWD